MEISAFITRVELQVYILSIYLSIYSIYLSTLVGAGVSESPLVVCFILFPLCLCQYKVYCIDFINFDFDFVLMLNLILKGRLIWDQDGE